MTNPAHDARHGLIEMRQNIIKTMKWNREYTSSEIAERLGTSKKRAAGQMAKLVESGHLKITGSKDDIKFFAFRDQEEAA